MNTNVNTIRNSIIIGAGPAGLMAGLKLAQAGKPVLVLEADSQVGGLCKTVRREGFCFDLGGHRFITRNEQLAEEIVQIVGEGMEVRPRTSTIRLRGKYFQYPLELKEIAMKLPLTLSFHCFADYLWTVVKNSIHSQPAESFEEWVVNRFGRKLYSIYFAVYSEKLWGMAPSRLSADWAAQRISLPHLGDVLLRLLGLGKGTPKTYATRFLYPSGGIGVISERMAEQLQSYGGTVRLNSPVVGIRAEGKRITSVLVKHKEQTEELKADFFINTMPLTNFLHLLSPSIGSSLKQKVDGLRYRSLRFLNLMLKVPRVSENCWIYIPEPEYIFFRIQEPSNWHPENAPAGLSSLILEIACNEGDELWHMDDKPLLERCVADLKRLGFDLAGKVLGYFSTYAPYAYPIYERDYAERLAPLQQYVFGFDNLISCGRQGLFRYNNMDHSLEMGQLAAEHIIKSTPREHVYAVASGQELFEKVSLPPSARNPAG